jgi:hypothetical protein
MGGYELADTLFNDQTYSSARWENESDPRAFVNSLAVYFGPYSHSGTCWS